MKRLIYYVLALGTLCWTGCGDSDDDITGEGTSNTDEVTSDTGEETNEEEDDAVWVAEISADENAELAVILAEMIDGVTLDEEGNALIYQEAIDATVELDLSEKGLSSLSGIEYFVNLTNLNCSNNNLETLALEALTQLTVLECQSNNIETLDLSSNTSLTILKCQENSLSSLDISSLINLTTLLCGNQSSGTVIVTMTEEQTTCWFDTWQSEDDNEDVEVSVTNTVTGNDFGNGGKF